MNGKANIIGRQIKNGKYRTGRGDGVVFVTGAMQPCVVEELRYEKFDGWCVRVTGSERSIQIEESSFLPEKRPQKILSWETWRTHNFKQSRSFSHADDRGARYFWVTNRHTILTESGFRRLDLPEFDNECHVLGEKGFPLTAKKAAIRWLEENYDGTDDFEEIVFWSVPNSIYVVIYGK